LATNGISASSEISKNAIIQDKIAIGDMRIAAMSLSLPLLTKPFRIAKDSIIHSATTSICTKVIVKGQIVKCRLNHEEMIFLG
jgi:hypothetical protein